MEAAQVLQVVGSASELPIADPEARHREHQAGRLVGAHPEAVERCLGLANPSLAGL